MTSEGAELDFAANAAPMLLHGVVPLHDRLKLEALRRAVEAFLAQLRHTPLHVLTRDGGLDAFDAHEVVLVERPQTFEARLEL